MNIRLIPLVKKIKQFPAHPSFNNFFYIFTIYSFISPHLRPLIPPFTILSIVHAKWPVTNFHCTHKWYFCQVEIFIKNHGWNERVKNWVRKIEMIIDRDEKVGRKRTLKASFRMAIRAKSFFCLVALAEFYFSRSTYKKNSAANIKRNYFSVKNKGKNKKNR